MHLKKFTIENFRKFGKYDNNLSLAANKEDSNLISSTLIIGQNNAGKTSIIAALKKASGEEAFNIADFNFDYLYSILEYFYAKKSDVKAIFFDGEEDVHNKRSELLEKLSPYMRFGYEFQVDSVNEDSSELLTNIAPIIKNELAEDGIVEAYVKYELKEQVKFIQELCSQFYDKKMSEDTFDDFIEFLNEGNYFEINVYTDEKCTEKVDNFSINNLVKVRTISCEKLHTPGRLSVAFNKIYNYKVKNDQNAKKTIEDKVKNINKEIDKSSIGTELANKVNKAFEKTLDSSNATMLLKSDLTIDSLLKNVIKYVYKDGKFEIPEDQFGLGYTSIMLIIAELVDYVDNSPETLFKNTINILVMEEPECYMHPQMQKLLIQNLNEAVELILDEKKLKINCQLLITSHSANIVYGKLDTENTFNNINYIACFKNKGSKIIALDDKKIMPNVPNDEKKAVAKEQFKFLKKHIKYACCDLFFADACLVVEGDAEQTILPFYIERDKRINKKYISILNVGGAYSHIYKNLFKVLNIPVAIITDLDIEGSANDTNQIKSLDKKETTNSTLKSFGFIIGKDFKKHDENIFIVTQEKIRYFYPTSFEESLILTNVDNTIIRDTLSNVMPKIYEKYKDNLESKSHLFLFKLGGKKGQFATTLLYKMINAKEEDIPILPGYIQDAIDYIAEQLMEQDNPQNEKTENIEENTLATQAEAPTKEDIINE